MKRLQMIMIRALVTVTWVMLVSCTAPRQAEPDALVPLECVNHREDFGSFGFLSGSQGMTWFEQKLWFSDAENSRLLVLDPSLNVLLQIGKAGQGPGELTLVGPCVTYRDRVFVTNIGAAGVSVFDKAGTFLELIPVPYCSFSTQFAVYDEQLMLSTPGKEKAITVAGFDGVPLTHFGERFDFGEERESITRSYRHLTIVETPEMPILVAAAESEPTLETYTLDGVKRASLNLANHPLLQARLREGELFREQHPERRFNTRVVLFAQIAAADQDLWVLVADQKPPYHLLRITVRQDSMLYQGALELNEPLSIHTFTVTPKRDVYLFDGQTHQLRHYRPRGL